MNDIGVALSQWRWPVLIVYNIVGSMQGIVWGTFNVNPDEVRRPLVLPPFSALSSPVAPLCLLCLLVLPPRDLPTINLPHPLPPCQLTRHLFPCLTILPSPTLPSHSNPMRIRIPQHTLSDPGVLRVEHHEQLLPHDPSGNPFHPRPPPQLGPDHVPPHGPLCHARRIAWRQGHMVRGAGGNAPKKRRRRGAHR